MFRGQRYRCAYLTSEAIERFGRLPQRSFWQGLASRNEKPNAHCEVEGSDQSMPFPCRRDCGCSLAFAFGLPSRTGLNLCLQFLDLTLIISSHCLHQGLYMCSQLPRFLQQLGWVSDVRDGQAFRSNSRPAAVRRKEKYGCCRHPCGHFGDVAAARQGLPQTHWNPTLCKRPDCCLRQHQPPNGSNQRLPTLDEPLRRILSRVRYIALLARSSEHYVIFCVAPDPNPNDLSISLGCERTMMQAYAG